MKLTEYIKDVHTDDMFEAFGIVKERVDDILQMLSASMEEALDKSGTNQLYALTLMEQNGFVLQNQREAAFIFYTLYRVVNQIEKNDMVSRLKETILMSIMNDQKEIKTQTTTKGPVN